MGSPVHNPHTQRVGAYSNSFHYFRYLQICPELGAYLDSRFANDFGSDNNGLDFQDGTCEQDVALSELLSLLQDGNECSFKETFAKKNAAVGCETPMSVPVQTVPQGLPICRTNKLDPEAAIDVAQKQVIHR